MESFKNEHNETKILEHLSKLDNKLDTGMSSDLGTLFRCHCSPQVYRLKQNNTMDHVSYTV